jgi:hypothetical protein
MLKVAVNYIGFDALCRALLAYGGPVALVNVGGAVQEFLDICELNPRYVMFEPAEMPWMLELPLIRQCRVPLDEQWDFVFHCGLFSCGHPICVVSVCYSFDWRESW